MMNFKLIGTGIAALSLLATSFAAEAADIPRPIYKGARSVVAYYNWTGFYAGLNAGYAFDRFLPYLTAGGAFGDIKAAATGLGVATSASASKFGWTFGGGLEYAFLSNWTAKVEYLYVDLGKFDCGISCGAIPDNVSFKSNIVRFGLNYKFAGPVFSRF